MAVKSLICPSCKNPLKSNNPIPVGTVVKCPGCQVNFTVPPEDYNPAAMTKKATGVASGRPPAGKAAPGTPPPRNGQRRDDDGYDNRRPSRSKSSGGNLGLILGLAGGGVVLLLALAAVSLWVWPGFLLTKSTPEPEKPANTSQAASTGKESKKKKKDGGESKADGKTGKDSGKAENSGKPGKDDSGKPKDPANSDKGKPGKEVGNTDKGKPGKDAGNTDKGKTDPGSLPPITDFTRFFPADTDFVVGLNLSGANNAVLKNLLQKFMAAAQSDSGLFDVVGDFEAGVIAGNSLAIEKGPPVAVMQTAHGHTLDEIRAGAGGTSISLAGKTLVRENNNFMFLPDPRSLVLMFNLPEAKVAELVAAQKSAVSRAELLDQVNKVRGKTLWAVAALDSNPLLKQMAKAPDLQKIPNGPQLASVLVGARHALITANFEDGSLKIDVTVVCKNNADAAAGENALKPLVLMLPAMIQLGIQQMKQVPDKVTSSLLADVSKLDVRATGANLTASLTFKKDTVSQVVALAESMAPPPGKSKKGISPIDARRRVQSQNNLKQLTLALHNYHDVYKFLPPQAMCGANNMGGKPLLSWRVALLPFIEEQKLYNEFKLDEPWDSPHNIKLLPRMPRVYAPHDGVKTREPNTTFYQVFVGPGTPFDFVAKKGVLAKGLGFVAINDGLSNTIGIVEAGEPVPWTRPDDLVYDAKKPLPKLGGTLFPDGFHCSMLDGTVRFVRMADPLATPRMAVDRGEVTEATLRNAITANDGKMLGQDWQ